PKIRVTARSERLDSIIADGRYKSTHEAQSTSSGASERRVLEQMWGIPLDAPAEVRPVSGAYDHKQFRQQRADYIAERLRTDPNRLRFEQTDPDFLPDYPGSIAPAGHLGIAYGDGSEGGSISFVLRADRANDSGMVFGDSALQGAKRPARATSTNSDDLLAAVLNPTEEISSSSRNRYGVENRIQTMALLNGILTGDYAGVSDPTVWQTAHADGVSVAQTADASTTRYIEALVPGGFDL
ncbi:uncharacterized protein METZ01_LOCUS488156, partial [marine metagenome]